jgi:hypothetical protein
MILGLALAATGLRAWSGDHWFELPKSPRIANYRIEAALDWQDKVLRGQETLAWRNTGYAPTAEVPLHLYLNAFKGPQSLFFKENGGTLGAPGRRWDPADARQWGYCRLTAVRLDGRELDGHFGEDATVYWVRLPRQVFPGSGISLEIEWESRFPLVHTRTGWSRDFLMGAQWFPKAGVYQGDHWTCRSYHAGAGFFADFGTYDVELSMPADLLLAHTGTRGEGQPDDPLPPDPHRAGNALWKLHAEDVHDFAWAAMPRNRWSRRSFEYRGVQVSCFLQPASKGGFSRQRGAIQAALKHGGEWLFPYPYPVFTIVDVPEGAEGADHLEYPTLATASFPPFLPLRLHLQPELGTIHEIGHQWFFGMLASDAAGEPWLDEGFATWFTRKTAERTYQGILNSRRFQAGPDTAWNAAYWRDPSVDPLSRTGYQSRDLRTGQLTARAKAPLVLDELEAMLGRPMMERVLHEYASEMAFHHPTRQDFQRIAERVTGRNLSGFWRDFMEGTEVLDVVIQGVTSQDVLEGGWMDAPGGPRFAAPQPAAPGRRCFVTLLRKGGLRVPVTLWARLENRTEQRLAWDGQDRWTTFEFDSPVTVAILDPDGNYPMLKDRLHANYTAKPVRRGLHYWSQMVWGAITGLLQGIGIG